MRALGRAVCIVLAVLLMVTLWLFVIIHTEWFRHQAAALISGNLDRQVVLAGPHSYHWSLQPRLRLEDVRVANAHWAQPPAMARARSIEVAVDVPALLRGRLQLSDIRVSHPELHLTRAGDGRANWDFLIDEDEPDAAVDPGIGRVRVEQGRIRYADGQQDLALNLLTEFDLDVARQTGQLDLGGDGHVRGVPLNASLSAWTPEPPDPLVVVGSVRSGEHRGELSGIIDQPLDMQGINLDIQLSGPDPGTLAAQIDPQLAHHELPELGDYQLAFLLLHDNAHWTLHDISGELGDSRFGGDLHILPGEPGEPGERPRITADFAVDRLDLDALELTTGGQPHEQSREPSAEQPVRAGQQFITIGTGHTGHTGHTGANADDLALGPGLHQTLLDTLAPLRDFDGELRLWIGELRAAGLSVRPLDFNARLERGELRVAPLTAGIAGGEIQLNGLLNIGQEAVDGEVAVDVTESVQLGAMDDAMPDALVDALGEAHLLHGRLQLQLTPEYLLVQDTELHLRDDGRRLAFRFEATTRDADDDLIPFPGDDALPRSHFRLVGVRNHQDFLADLFMGPLLSLTEQTTAPPLDAQLRAGGTFVRVSGQLQRLLEERAVDARFDARGPDLDALGTLLGMDAPTVPAFQVSASLDGRAGEWHLRDFSGQMGDSDLAGSVTLLLEPLEPPRVLADLRSRLLDVDNLTQDPAEEREAGITELLEAVNGDLRYQADRIRTGRLPLDFVRLHGRIEGTRLDLAPLEFRLGEGRLHLSGFLDGDQVPMQGHLDMDISGIDLGGILPAFGIEDDTAGIVSGRADIHVEGHTYMDWLYSARGELRVLLTGGEVDTLLVELAGPETADEIMQYLLPEDAAILDLECAHVATSPDQGLITIDNIFVTTPNINVLAEGTVDLNQETVDLTLGSESEDVDIMDLLTPIEISGPWEELEIGVITADLLARALAAVTLGAVLGPGAAAAPGVLAPLLPGLGDDPTPCHEIIEEALAEIEDVNGPERD